ncbi:adenosylmethionine--8-amino-7-oxononanoate transaminase [Buchnera aphidicola (Pemphigus obesinymphae)]|uniref:adenosylmethionine--8-amino-7-oxononanoate transaminase n=1 Tax=Buchnera aphidicola TaxID=9 RepID=UPI0022370C86|nr:adenosylmethionine--8-amino-7-oxononanoate transaminase [Buchnera aphidicola]MCW5196701.1 adenosylmethionine--8-amino-7-oxononanoate transaminase [Buchnera aphidicola (Pemphigus obesinymphae)]
MNKSDLYFDLQHIWHPYSSMSNPIPCYPIISAKGIYLKLNNGKTIIDGMSSWWSAIHGYNNPRLNQSLKNQIKKMSHVMFGGITHPSAVLLCRKLNEITPKELECIFLCDSGSVAIEVAMKMSLQYWQALGEKRCTFLTIRNGYHGDTFFAMSVSDPTNSIHGLYNHLLPSHLFADAPKCNFGEFWDEKDIYSFSLLIKKNKESIAAVILEPIVQGAGGMKFYHPKYLKKVRYLCDYYKIPLIIDEIATGFGRTGKFFAYKHADIVPDILCIGKALTGGMISLSATITTKKIAHIISNSKANCFMHGPTFMGNPLACAVASENISMLQEKKWKNQVLKIESILKINLLPLQQHPKVLDVRVLGAIGVVECFYTINIKKIQFFFVQNGVWIRPFNKLIYLIPPYIIDSLSLKQLIDTIAKALDNDKFFIC